MVNDAFGGSWGFDVDTRRNRGADEDCNTLEAICLISRPKLDFDADAASEVPDSRSSSRRVSSVPRKDFPMISNIFLTRS